MPAAPTAAVAAGHPLTARVGADVLRAGGNAVDAAVAAVMASLVSEPLLTGLGAGGYLLVVEPDGAATLLDFFVAAPGRGVAPGEHAPLQAVDVSFGDATQRFHAGPASVGAYGTPAGLAAAVAAHGSVALAELAAPAAQLAREGVPLSAQQAYILEILRGIVALTPEAASLFLPGGRPLRAGERFSWPDLGAALERLGRDGAEPFYAGPLGEAAVAAVARRGGLLSADDLAAYEARALAPLAVPYRDRRVLLAPPPSAGGILIAHALAALDRAAAPPDLAAVVAAMEGAQAQRTPAFLDGLADAGFAQRFLAEATGRSLGSTTHISVLDRDGRACAVTCSNGEGSGLVVPGTGLHLNNVLGEEDLNPLGFHRHEPGRRLPSMMCPTVVLDPEGRPEVVLGSGGSNRIRSALLQTIVGVVDRGDDVQAAVDAPRAHVEAGTLYVEPGVDAAALAGPDRALQAFRERSLFFGGVHAVRRDPAGAVEGAGDPRRGGAVALV